MTNSKETKTPHVVTDLHSKESAYELSVNGLEDLVAFEHTPAGLCVVSKISAPAGSHFAFITSHVPQPKASWKTIQTSATTQTDPRSALLYMNHSCAPSLEVHTYAPDADGNYPTEPPSGKLGEEAKHLTPAGLAGEVKVARDRDVKPGDALTFFYPSTEWHMDRPFECLCGAGDGVCLGTVAGADAIDEKGLEKWFFNEHIWQLVKERESK
ncbi:uncharacterized protein MYCFIDRAFT_163973 [Pseudocercospora fijiensis CIRAD86]|uniref:SET domain-containing protein n=1 Tax=Pseudocercospora fijiensis (strain CIRAD86) TaxID=383855 RepID=M3ADI3_PSEFD|nr:uncharacterized protein MYCFIDRAFT_163973 [Pseudocercospora fijiensis CIRAD86]EME82606.1 hypothetical protein MYCFIDRAFT_163973 [Pseudocercospora fijiensis CIRAD86]